MPKNTQDIRTLGYVLRRTNYGEADRILNIITPEGKISAIAKGVRKEKSKLAGGIEMFSRIDLNIHQGKDKMGIVTSAKMLKYFGNILKDFSRTETAAMVLKKISVISDSSDSPDYYYMVDQTMEALDDNTNLDLIKIWFNFNLKKVSGEDINLYRDTDGQKLDSSKIYSWDFYEKALKENPSGDITANEIKIMRLVLTNKLKTVAKIKNIGELISPISAISNAL
ncbi:DNA repair protein RecO [Candidatus Saccharibacteria bacterium]|nr:DNA repair protein RecO [Candidatus Saccharibacteria bacterium]